MPKRMRQHFGPIVIEASDQKGFEMSPEEIYQLFKATYMNLSTPVELLGYREQASENTILSANILIKGVDTTIEGEGNGIVDAFCRALSERLGLPFEIADYSEHSMEHGSKSRAITYIEITSNDATYFGVGVSRNTGISSLRAVVSAVNKLPQLTK